MGNKHGKEKRSTKAEKKLTDVDSPGRINICNEIIETERHYIANLETLVAEFMLPLKTNHKILKPKFFHTIFANIDEILEVQHRFLQKLQEASTDTETRRLGAVLSQEAPSLKVYTKYINNYNEALTALSHCQKKFPHFSSFLQEKLASAECNGLSLSAYLIMPIQRIPRYVLLYTDLMKHTTENHIDYKPTLVALDDIKEVADYVNEEKRIAEEIQHLLEIESNLSGFSSKLALRNRFFIKEGVLKIIAKKGSEPADHQYILFNDLFLLCVENLSFTSNLLGRSKKNKVVYEMKLLNTEVVELKDRHDLQNSFELKTKKVDVIVTFDSAEEKTEWLDEFYKIRAKAPVID